MWIHHMDSPLKKRGDFSIGFVPDPLGSAGAAQQRFAGAAAEATAGADPLPGAGLNDQRVMHI